MNMQARNDHEERKAICLKTLAPMIRRRLPPSGELDRFLVTVESAIDKDPNLLQPSTQRSFFLAVAEVAAQNLILGEQCHIVPFKGSLKMVPDWRGYAALMRRTFPGLKFHRDCAYKGDPAFEESSDGRTHTLKHTKSADPQRGLNPRDTLTHAYLRLIYPDGTDDVIVLSRAQLLVHEKASKFKDLWREYFDQMCMKACYQAAYKSVYTRPEDQRSAADVLGSVGQRLAENEQRDIVDATPQCAAMPSDHNVVRLEDACAAAGTTTEHHRAVNKRQRAQYEAEWRKAPEDAKPAAPAMLTPEQAAEVEIPLPPVAGLNTDQTLTTHALQGLEMLDELAGVPLDQMEKTELGALWKKVKTLAGLDATWIPLQERIELIGHQK